MMGGKILKHVESCRSGLCIGVVPVLNPRSTRCSTELPEESSGGIQARVELWAEDSVKRGARKQVTERMPPLCGLSGLGPEEAQIGASSRSDSALSPNLNEPRLTATLPNLNRISAPHLLRIS